MNIWMKISLNISRIMSSMAAVVYLAQTQARRIHIITTVVVQMLGYLFYCTP